MGTVCCFLVVSRWYARCTARRVAVTFLSDSVARFHVNPSVRFGSVVEYSSYTRDALAHLPLPDDFSAFHIPLPDPTLDSYPIRPPVFIRPRPHISVHHRIKGKKGTYASPIAVICRRRAAAHLWDHLCVPKRLVRQAVPPSGHRARACAGQALVAADGGGGLGGGKEGKEVCGCNELHGLCVAYVVPKWYVLRWRDEEVSAGVYIARDKSYI